MVRLGQYYGVGSTGSERKLSLTAFQPVKSWFDRRTRIVIVSRIHKSLPSSVCGRSVIEIGLVQSGHTRQTAVVQ